MKKNIFCVITVILLLMVLPSFASEREIGMTLEYYHTGNKEIINRVYVMELTNEENKQKLYNDLRSADEGSQRTLNALLGIFKWYHVSQFRKALTPESRVFSEEFIVPEDAISSQSAMLLEKQLDISFHIKTKRNRFVPVGMNIIYDYRELFSDIPRYYPMDKFILLDAVNMENDGDEVLEVLIMKLMHHETEEPVQEEILKEIQ